MALYLVDGDNNPCIGTKGAEWLTEADRMIIFYNNSNAYYKLEQNRSRFEQSTRAEVSFEVIPCSKNSVDFAVAVKAGLLAKEYYNQKIFLVSADNHFELIAKLIRQETGAENRISHIEAVWKGVLMDGDNLTDLEMIHDILQNILGAPQGNVLYKKMKKLTKNQVKLKLAQAQQKADQEHEKMLTQDAQQKKESRLFRRLIIGLAGAKV